MYRVLGPVEVGEERCQVGGPRERRALSALLLEANRPVSVDRLIAAIWDEAPPPTAAAQIRNVMAILRRRLPLLPDGRSPIQRVGNGFSIEVRDNELDLVVFQRRLTQARRLAAVQDYEPAAQALRAALALWRGEMLGGMGGFTLSIDVHRLEEERLAAVELLMEIDLALGRHRESIGELATLVYRHPLRERFVELQMVALNGAGRRQDALNCFAAVRQRLKNEVGLDPQPELVKIHAAILRGESLTVTPTVMAVSARSR
jgi:DNA-binding SARP family transcriptional activator